MCEALELRSLTGRIQFRIDSRGGESGRFFRERLSNIKDSRRLLKNIFDIFVGRPKYLGCTMAFRREFVSLVLPIPAYSETHDLWLALAANLIGSHVHLEATTLRKRHHQANFTEWFQAEAFT